MEEPDTALTPHKNVSSSDKFSKEPKSSGNPKHLDFPRSDPRPSKGKPNPGNRPKSDTVEGRTTPSTPRSVTPDSKGNDSAATQQNRKSKSKLKPSGTSDTKESGRSSADKKPPTKSDSRRRRGQEKPHGGTTDASDPRPPRRKEESEPRSGNPGAESENIHDSADAGHSPLELGPPRRRRRGNFDGKLTAGDSGPLKETRHVNPDREKYWVDYTMDDLTSKLIRDLRTSPYLDCVVCYNPIRPLQPTWSCSPCSPAVLAEGAQEAEYCWVTLHLKCVRSWASKGITDTRKAYEARSENKPGEWLCIGCRAKRTIEPSSYRSSSSPVHSCSLLKYDNLLGVSAERTSILDLPG
jgi:transcriptional repressor NF-X1